jgi:hypothetical protein
MTFTISAISNNEHGTDDMKCVKASNCLITYKKNVTPVVFYLSPPVVYYESFSEIVFDPKYTTSLISGLSPDEMQFINAKIGGSLMDFELDVTHETIFSGMSRNSARGQVGELPISGAYNLSMQWETGKALI